MRRRLSFFHQRGRKEGSGCSLSLCCQYWMWQLTGRGSQQNKPFISPQSSHGTGAQDVSFHHPRIDHTAEKWRGWGFLTATIFSRGSEPRTGTGSLLFLRPGRASQASVAGNAELNRPLTGPVPLCLAFRAPGSGAWPISQKQSGSCTGLNKSGLDLCATDLNSGGNQSGSDGGWGRTQRGCFSSG